jgi:hypothetical protein
MLPVLSPLKVWLHFSRVIKSNSSMPVLNHNLLVIVITMAVVVAIITFILGFYLCKKMAL